MMDGNGWIAADGAKRVRENSGQRQSCSRRALGDLQSSSGRVVCGWTGGVFAEVEISFRACFSLLGGASSGLCWRDCALREWADSDIHRPSDWCSQAPR